MTNKKVFHDYFVEEQFEAGLLLEGWEAKAIRSHRVSVGESYVVIRNGEIFLIGMHVSPCSETSTHHATDPLRTRKLLLNKREISRLIGKVERAGYALVLIDLHYSRGKVKANIGLAKGKKLHDKRASEKEKSADMDAKRAMRGGE